MPCMHPIWIRNRRYCPKKDGTGDRSYEKSQLALAPWDVSRQWLMVPCGHCEDCLRRQRNDWFVRIEREMARYRAISQQVIFITITIAPKYYDEALRDPSRFIRRWNERVRHRIGHSFKHCYFQEFGLHPSSDGQPRLHFHGFLFGVNIAYEKLRSCVSDLGFVWLGKATLKRARYVVKYVTKQLCFNEEDIKDKYITIDGVRLSLSSVLKQKRYSRKFVSAHVGDYLGERTMPTGRVFTWDYMDCKTGAVYRYAVPRYYDRYYKPEQLMRRAILSADTYARFSSDSLVSDIVRFCVKRLVSDASLSSRETHVWQLKKYKEFSSAGKIPEFTLPAWITEDILISWKNLYGLDLSLIT